MAAALLILPDFALILVGLVLARAFTYGREFWSGLEKLVYYVLFPALLVRSLATARIDLAATGLAIGVAVAFTATAFLLSLAAGPVLKLDRKLLAAGSQCGYRFNTYVGLAIAGSLYGTPGIALAALLLGALIPLVNLAAVAVLARHGEGGFVREIVRHPLVLACIAGFALNALGWEMPAPLEHGLALLGQASLATGLLCVGAAMRFEAAGGEWRAHVWWLAVKLVVAPALAWLLVRRLGIGGMEARVLILCAALPTATSAYILAAQMAGDARAVATQVTAGTLTAMVTLPLWLSA
jgi:malonate transporter